MDNSNRNNRSSISNKNEASSKKNHLISVFKSFEATINDKKKKYFDKVQSLLIAWEQLAVYVSAPSSESPEPEFESLFLHTLRFVLRADWPRASVATQTHLTVTLQRFITVLSTSKRYPSILQLCRVLESVVKNPWSHPVLSKIFTDEEVEIDDLLKYFQFENGKVIVVRLEMMLEAQCEDMALRLSKSCLLTHNNSHPLELEFNQNEIDYITDIYFCTLYRDKKKKELTNEIKLYELDDGLQLLKRYNKNGGVGKGFNDNCKDVRVWKCSDKVMELVANTLLANAVLHDDLVDSDTILPELIAEWAVMQKPDEGTDFSPIALEIIRKLVISAGSSKCIYPFCSFLIENCACKELYLNFVAKCLIRAINQNMNEIENYRVSREYDSLKSTYEQLSQGFVLISKLFDDHKNIYRECLLTSFSLKPTREGLKELEAFIDKATNTITEESSAVVETERERTAEARDDQIVPSSPKNPLENLNSDTDVVSEPFLVAENDAEKNEPIEKNAAESVGSKPDEENVAESPIPEDSEAPVSDPESIMPSLPDAKNDVPSAPDPKNSESLVEVALSTPDSPKNEANETENIVETKKDLLSLKTDTKLKSDGAVEEIVREAAPAYCAEVEKLKLDESMKMDLSSILRYQRFRSLSWEFDWSELKVNCEKFLEMFVERGFDEVELKYLDLDYSQFKDQPINEDDYIGIEKGYEHFIEPSWEEEEADYHYQQYNGAWPQSSADTDRDDDYERRRRKKIMRRNKLKKAKAKLKAVYEGSSEEFVSSPGDATVAVVKKKRKSSVDSVVDGEIKVRRKRTKKFKTLSANTQSSDVNIDSQAENHPPDDMSASSANEETVDATTLQMLRQFRIGMKTSNGGELSEITSSDAKLNSVNQLTPVKIIIPKCDNEMDTDFSVAKAENEDAQSSEKRVVKRPKPRNSVTLPFPGKRSTLQLSSKKRAKEAAFSIRCEVRLPKNESIDQLMLCQGYENVAPAGLDDELRALLDSFDTSQTADSDAALSMREPSVKNYEVAPECVPKKENAVSPSHSEPAPSVRPQIDAAPSTAQVKVKPAVLRRRVVKKEGPKRPRGRPRKYPRPDDLEDSTLESQSCTPEFVAETSTNSYLVNSSYLMSSSASSLPPTSFNSVPALPTSSYTAEAGLLKYFTDGVPTEFTSTSAKNHFLNSTSADWNTNCNSLAYKSSQYDFMQTAPRSYTDLNAASSSNNFAAAFDNAQTTEFAANTLPSCTSTAPTLSFPPTEFATNAIPSPSANDVLALSCPQTVFSTAANVALARNCTRTLFSTNSIPSSTFSCTNTEFAANALPSSTTTASSPNSCATVTVPELNNTRTESSANVISPSTGIERASNCTHTRSPTTIGSNTGLSDSTSNILQTGLQQAPIHIANDDIEAVQQMQGMYNELVYKFPETPLTPTPRKRTLNGVKRQRKSKTDAALDGGLCSNGQPKAKWSRKPKKQDWPFDASKMEANPVLNGHVTPQINIKIRRPRKPKKEDVTLSDQSATFSIPEMNLALDAPPPTFQHENDVERARKPKKNDFAFADQSSAFSVSGIETNPVSNGHVTAQLNIKIRRPRKPKKKDVTLSDQSSAFSVPETNFAPDAPSPTCQRENEVKRPCNPNNKDLTFTDQSCTFSIPKVDRSFHEETTTNQIENKIEPTCRSEKEDLRIFNNQYPVVLIPEIKIPNVQQICRSQFSKTAVNGVKRPRKPRKKYVTNAGTPKAALNHCDQFPLLPLQVRLPPMSLTAMENFPASIPAEANALSTPSFDRYSVTAIETDSQSTLCNRFPDAVNVPKQPAKSRKKKKVGTPSHASYSSEFGTSTSPTSANEFGSNAVNGVKKRAPRPRKPRAPKNAEDGAAVTPKKLGRPRKQQNVAADSFMNASTAKILADEQQKQNIADVSFINASTSEAFANEGQNIVDAPFINASTPKTLAEGYSVIAVPDINNVPNPQSIYVNELGYQGQFLSPVHQYPQMYDMANEYDETVVHMRQQQQQQFGEQQQHSFDSSQNYSSPSYHEEPQHQHQVQMQANGYSQNQFAIVDANTNSTSMMNVNVNGDNSMQSTMNTNIMRGAFENVKIQYSGNINSDSTGVCISIPEDACNEPFLGNYLAFIQNTTSSDSLPLSEQSISSNTLNNDIDDLFRQFFPTDQMTTYGSL